MKTTLTTLLFIVTVTLQPAHSQGNQTTNGDGSPIINNNGKIGKIEFHIQKGAPSAPSAPTEDPIPPKVAVEGLWAAFMKLAVLQTPPTDKQITEAVPHYVLPTDKNRIPQAIREHKDAWPNLRRLWRFATVRPTWIADGEEELDKFGSTRYAFLADWGNLTIQGSPVPNPRIRITVDLDKNGRPRGYNLEAKDFIQ